MALEFGRRANQEIGIETVKIFAILIATSVAGTSSIASEAKEFQTAHCLCYVAAEMSGSYELFEAMNFVQEQLGKTIFPAKGTAAWVNNMDWWTNVPPNSEIDRKQFAETKCVDRFIAAGLAYGLDSFAKELEKLEFSGNTK